MLSFSRGRRDHPAVLDTSSRAKKKKKLCSYIFSIPVQQNNVHFTFIYRMIRSKYASICIGIIVRAFFLTMARSPRGSVD